MHTHDLSSLRLTGYPSCWRQWTSSPAVDGLGSSASAARPRRGQLSMWRCLPAAAAIAHARPPLPGSQSGHLGDRDPERAGGILEHVGIAELQNGDEHVGCLEGAAIDSLAVGRAAGVGLRAFDAPATASAHGADRRQEHMNSGFTMTTGALTSPTRHRKATLVRAGSWRRLQPRGSQSLLHRRPPRPPCVDRRPSSASTSRTSYSSRASRPARPHRAPDTRSAS
ncbi:MAG: hypothetical protein JWP01_878 [Myxococcales bacterium]|nr:hypothetical protein [Myxococcales bacterium]